MQPADIRLPRVGLLQPRRLHLAGEQRQVRVDQILARDRRERVGRAEEGAVSLANAGGVVHEERDAAAALSVDGRVQRVLVRVGEVRVDAPARAHHVVAVAAQVIREPDTRLNVVRILLRRLAEVLEDRSGEAPRGPRRLHHLEVRVAALIERHAGHVVVANAGVDGQLVGDTPVVLQVGRVEVERDVRLHGAADDLHRLHGRVEVVGAHGEEAREAGRRADEQTRLVQPVAARLEVVFEAAEAARRPADVIAQLPLRLLRRLRRRRVRAAHHAVGEDQHRLRRAAGDRVVERRDLEDQRVQLRAAEQPAVVGVERVERVGARRPAGMRRERPRAARRRAAVVAIANRHIVPAAQIGGHLAGEEVLAHGNREHAVLRRKEPQRIDGLLSVLLRALERPEVEHAVLGDRTADAAAVLVAAIVLLRHVAQRLALGLGVHRRVAEQRERAAADVVGAALGHHVHDGAAAAVLRVEALRHHVELLNRLERIHLRETADGVVVVVAAVDDVIDVAAVAAADLRHVFRRLRRIRVEAETHAGHRRREIGELPAVERQPFDARQIDHLADRRGGRRDERRVAHDGDRLRDRGEPKRQIEIRRLRDVDRDVLALETDESGKLRDDVVGADGHRVEVIQAFAVADVGAREAGGRVGGRHRGAGDRHPLRIEHEAGDRAGGLLGRCGGGGERHEQCRQQPNERLHQSSGGRRGV